MRQRTVTGGLFAARISMTARGYAVAVSQTGRHHVAAEDLGGAIHGDTVMIKRRGSPDNPRYRVESIVSRGLKELTGVYFQHRSYGEVRPDESRLGFSFMISGQDGAMAKDGDRVLVEITRYPEPGKDARAKVLQVVGQAGDPRIDAMAIGLRFGFPIRFGEAASEEAGRAPQSVVRADFSERVDLRKELIVTIDGDDAKDFDDAVSLQLSGGKRRLGVHIADVSAYVTPGSALDTAAYDKTTSVYLHGFVIPMLPFELSNGICSLNPGEDRLTFSVFLDFDEEGEAGTPAIALSVIRSQKRLTYSEVNRFFETGETSSPWPEGLPAMLSTMRELAHKLRDRRFLRGSLDFDFPEIKVTVDANGNPTDVGKYVRGDAEKLIEEFMISANEAVAGYLVSLGQPCMFRVHERPDKAELDELNEVIGPMGYRIKGTNNAHPRSVQAVLVAAKGKPDETLVSELVLRSLKKARYSPTWLGHFGLSSPFYCHFTSPIRRYPDLIVHRILKSVTGAGLSGEKYGQVRSALDEQAERCSEREIAAQNAERESLELMKARYMLEKVGDIFQGVVQEAVAFGLFVTMENGITGLLHVSLLPQDHYDFDEQKKLMRGRKSGRVFKSGDKVAVQVLRVDVESRHIELGLIE